MENWIQGWKKKWTRAILQHQFWTYGIYLFQMEIFEYMSLKLTGNKNSSMILTQRILISDWRESGPYSSGLESFQAYCGYTSIQ